MKKYIAVLFAFMFMLFTGCTRIETGEVGIRIDASKQVSQEELRPGSINQTIVGSVLTFPVKDIALDLNDKTPMTADNSALADFDITVIYNINPSSVAELYSNKSKSFNATDDSGDVYLMYNYISTLVNNAVYKSVRQYPALGVADNRANIEKSVQDEVTAQLKAENLDTSITINQVQVRNILPNAEILASSTRLVKAQNDLAVKNTEVEIAKKEAERMSALATNSTQSIAYMQAQAQLNISEAVKEGKVNTIIIPSNMTALGSFK